jgi:hypothetical protein
MDNLYGPKENKGGTGSTVAIISIVGLLIVGGLYVWGSRVALPQQVPVVTNATTTSAAPTEEPLTGEDAQVGAAISSLGLDTISADIEATLNQIDKDLGL